MLRFIKLFVRYVAAIIVATIVSIGVLYLGASSAFAIEEIAPHWMGPLGIGVIFVLVGFCGVLTGSRCLEQGSRRHGSIVLLLLGLAYYAFWAFLISTVRAAENAVFPYVGCLPLAIGGAAAVVFYFRKHPTTQALVENSSDAL